MEYTILVVDDVEKLCKIIVKDFQLIGHSAFYATNGTDALQMVEKEKIDVVLLDLKLGNEDGVEVLKEIKKSKPYLPVFMITAHGSISNAVHAIKNGAHDYIQKPVNFDKLLKMVENAVHLEALKEENLKLKNLLHDKTSEHFITANPHMLSLLEKLAKFSATDFPVLITGESGTGKELIAEYLHMNSPRKGKELFKVNCAAFSESLLDDELFGHYKGAFTGADQDFMGVFERAHGATLFLDEIGDMPLSIQAKILRTLQNREVRRLGGKKNILVDVRFIAATNKNLQEMIHDGTFREDFYFRLNTLQVNIPPLRERKEDILLIAHSILKENSGHEAGPAKQFDPSVEDFFMNYSWPGNVRELKNVINYSRTISTGNFINISDLPNYLMKTTLPKVVTIHNRTENSEKLMIIEALAKCRYNKSKTADFLQISRRTLYNKMERFGINA